MKGLTSRDFLQEAIRLYQSGELDLDWLCGYVANWFCKKRNDDVEGFDRTHPFGKKDINFEQTMQILQDTLSLEEFVYLRIQVGQQTGL